jgi:hypothetical protein
VIQPANRPVATAKSRARWACPHDPPCHDGAWACQHRTDMQRAGNGR